MAVVQVEISDVTLVKILDVTITRGHAW